MSVLLAPLRYGLNKSVEAAFNLDKSREARTTLVMGASTRADDDRDASKAARGFHPQYAVALRRPRTSLEAQKLYNHIRTVAWYLDAIPFFGRRMPFGMNIGVDSIVGIVPGIGDYIGLVLGAYQVLLIALFGVPLRLLLLLLFNIVLDAVLGLVPILGDALDVAFKANLRNLSAFEDHMCSTHGRCGAGTFELSFPPSTAFLPHVADEPQVSVSATSTTRGASSATRTLHTHAPEPAGGLGAGADVGASTARSRRSMRNMQPGDRLGDFGPPIDVAPLALPASLAREVDVREAQASLQASELARDGELSGSPGQILAQAAGEQDEADAADQLEGYRIADPADEADPRAVPAQSSPDAGSIRSFDSGSSTLSLSTEASSGSGSDAHAHSRAFSVAPSTMADRPLSVLDAEWILQPTRSQRRSYSRSRDYGGLLRDDDSALSAPLLGCPSDEALAGAGGANDFLEEGRAAGHPAKPPRPRDAGRAPLARPQRSLSDDCRLVPPRPDAALPPSGDGNGRAESPAARARRYSNARRARRSSAAAESGRSAFSDFMGAEEAHSRRRRRRRAFILVYASIFCICFFTSLEANQSYLYFNFALSEFGALASFSTVAIAQQMVFAVAKPGVAKMSDVFGRAEAYLFSLVLYALGYSIVASARGIEVFIAGIVVQAAGTTGLQVLQSIIIADTTSPQYRGLVLGIVNVPYLINFAIAGPLVDLVIRKSSWRFGFWIWTFVVPVAALPLLVTLALRQRRARRRASTHGGKHGAAPSALAPAPSFGAKLRRLGAELDVVGLALMAVGWLLILLPLSLRDRLGLAGASYCALGGVAVLGLFLFWETKVSVPIVPFRVLTNRPVIAVCAIAVFDFASFTLSWTYLSAFVQVLRSWEQTRTAYFATTQNITSTLMGILVGYLMSATRRYRALLIGGVCIRLLGVALMVRYRNAHDAVLLQVIPQILQGFGGGAIAITMVVAAQICVRTADVAVVTAFQLLSAEIGAAIGSAAAGMIVSGYLPGLLQRHLPMLPADEVREIYGSLQVALSYPLGSEVRRGIIDAWVEVMRFICVCATVILVPALFLALAMPNATLPDHRHYRGPSAATDTDGSPVLQQQQQSQQHLRSAGARRPRSRSDLSTSATAATSNHAP